MGTSRSTAQLVGKIDRYAKSFGKANRAGTSAAALRYKERAILNVTRDTGGDRKLSGIEAGRFGLQRNAPNLGASYKLFGYTNAKAVLNPYPYGLWSLLDGGRRGGYAVRPFRYKRRKGGKQSAAERGAYARGGSARKALAFPMNGHGSGFAASATPGPTKGKRTFRDVPRQAERAAKRSFQRAHHKALLDVFK